MKTILRLTIALAVICISQSFAMPGDDTLLTILRQPAASYRVGDTVDIKLGGNGRAAYITNCIASIEIDGGSTFHCWIGGPATSTGSDTSRFKWVVPTTLARKSDVAKYDYLDLVGKTCTIKFASLNDVALTVTTLPFTVSAASKVLGPNQRLSKNIAPVGFSEGAFSASGRVADEATASGLYLIRTPAGIEKTLTPARR